MHIHNVYKFTEKHQKTIFKPEFQKKKAQDTLQVTQTWILEHTQHFRIKESQKPPQDTIFKPEIQNEETHDTLEVTKTWIPEHVQHFRIHKTKRQSFNRKFKKKKKRIHRTSINLHRPAFINTQHFSIHKYVNKPEREQKTWSWLQSTYTIHPMGFRVLGNGKERMRRWRLTWQMHIKFYERIERFFL